MNKKVSVITGGAGGIGRAIAGCLGRTSTLVLVGRNEDNLKKMQGQLITQGMEVEIFPADVSDARRIDELAEFAAALGDVQNVINSAGVDPSNAFTGDKIIAVNAVGTVNMVRSFYPVICEGGVHINFASLVAHHGPGNIDELLAGWGSSPDIYNKWDEPDFGSQLVEAVRTTVGGGTNEEIAGPCYAASKKFVVYFSKMNVDRYAAKGARILSVSPGLTITPMHMGFVRDEPEIAAAEFETIPLGRKAQAHELGSLVEFLCSSKASFVNGTDILIDGGQIANVKMPQVS